MVKIISVDYSFLQVMGSSLKFMGESPLVRGGGDTQNIKFQGLISMKREHSSLDHHNHSLCI